MAGGSEAAFKQIRRHIVKVTYLTAPEEQRNSLAYLVAPRKRPRVSVKGQVLANFIVERPEEEGQDDSVREEEPLPAWWTLFTDESSCIDGCGAGVILRSTGRRKVSHTL
ncbi:hypothetical protein Tco_0280944 [Tanacetum coccineum]